MIPDPAALRAKCAALAKPAAVLLLALCTAGAPAVHAQRVAEVDAPRVAMRQQAIEKARELSRTLVAAQNLPGLSVAVGVGDDVVWAEGFGWADLEMQVPVTPLSRFRIGSVSKSLTSVAVGLLYQQGRIDLDAPVQHYVPSFPRKRWPVTTRQLMAHTAGIRHYGGDEFLSTRHYPGVLDGLAIFKDDPLLFEPGTQYRYSSYGWNLVSAVVQAAAGEEFLACLRTRVFAPAGMRDTVADDVARIVPRRVAFYSHDPQGRLVNAPFVDNSYKWAGGGFLSTPSDLVRFGYALLDDSLLDASTRELLWSPVRLASGEPTGRGLDWALETDARGRRTVGHTGGSVGGTTLFAIYPDQRMVIAVATNLGDADGLDALTANLADLFAPAPR